MVISCIHEEDFQSIAEVVLSGCRTVFTYIYSLSRACVDVGTVLEVIRT